MIRILKVKTYSGYILDNPGWVIASGMFIIKFHLVLDSDNHQDYLSDEIVKISVRVYKKEISSFDLFKYQMGDWLYITGLVCIDENNDINRIDDSDTFLMII